MSDPEIDFRAEIFARLAAPFDQVREMPGKGGRPIQYVTARDVMNRLDDVLGFENWWDDYESTEHGTICRLSLRLGDDLVVTKTDGGGSADLDNEDWAEKSSYSGSFKRAAVKFGIGRYLYRDGVPGTIRHLFEDHTPTVRRAQTEAPRPTTTRARTEPYTAQDAGPPPARTGGDGDGRRGGGGGGGGGGERKYLCPWKGNALFAWMKDREDEFGVAVLKVVNGHPQIKGVFPQRMTEWSLQQIRFGYDVMVNSWVANDAWPVGVEPGYLDPPQDDRQQPPADVRYDGGHDTHGGRPHVGREEAERGELVRARFRLRETATKVLVETEPDAEVNYPNQLRVVNETAEELTKGEKKIDNLLTCKDLPLMEQVQGELERYLFLARDNTCEPYKGG